MTDYEFKDQIKEMTYEEALQLQNVLSNKTLLNSTIGTSNKINGAQLLSVDLQSIKDTSMIAIQGWTFSGVFSATDNDTVAWTAGTITLASGATFSINAGSTGNMTGLTYIYFNKAVSLVELQITGGTSTAIGANKILITVANKNADATSSATFQVFGGTGGILLTTANLAANTITANEIAANTITAAEMNVATLSSISANIGAITAGTITSTTIRTSAGNGRVELATDDTLKCYDTSGNLALNINTQQIKLAAAVQFNFTGTNIESYKNFIPDTSNSLDLGGTANRFKYVYASGYFRSYNGANTAYMQISHDGTNAFYQRSTGSHIFDNHVYPEADNSYTSGKYNLRWSDTRTVLLNGSDIGFENDWYLTEADRMGIDKKGVAMVDENNDLKLFIGEDGLYVPGGKIKNLDTLPWVKTTLEERCGMDNDWEGRTRGKNSKPIYVFPDFKDAKIGGGVYKLKII